MIVLGFSEGGFRSDSDLSVFLFCWRNPLVCRRGVSHGCVTHILSFSFNHVPFFVFLVERVFAAVIYF